MARNYKIGELNESAIYSVSLIDNWDGHAESKTMTGAELKSFTNAAAHLYDIHATEIKEDTAADVEKEETKMFAMIEKNVREDHAKTAAGTACYIEHGYFPTWAEEHRNEPDRGLKYHSTATRWNQYTAGTLSREKAVELATKRAYKEIQKDTAAKLEKLDRVSNAPDLEFISISVEWVRSKTWGHNPHVEIRTNTGTYTGTASGCGYDKESAAVATALNQCDSVLKALYTLKENGLREGKTDESKTASCGRSNGDICGYGAGYGAIPYFEGGVGVRCFWSILEKCGFTVSCHYGKHSNYCSVSKKEG